MKARFPEELSFLRDTDHNLHALPRRDAKLHTAFLNEKDKVGVFALVVDFLIVCVVRGVSASTHL